MKRDAMLLVQALRDPASTGSLDADGWTALIAMARAEQLIGTLAYRLKSESVPPKILEILEDACLNAEYQRRSALWEAECAARALADYPGKVILLKGTAYVAADLKAGKGRHIGDLDIMVARADLPTVEALLIEKGGWEWVKEDAYDDAYYRDHMHELPPLIHKERDRMIDVHHTILPLTARPMPDAEGMLAESKPLLFRGGVGVAAGCEADRSGIEPDRSDTNPIPSSKEEGLSTLSPPDMICHCAAHLLADGDLAGGLRNLWDIHCLVQEFEPTGPNSLHAWDSWIWSLFARAEQHQLKHSLSRALRLSHFLFGAEGDRNPAFLSLIDRLYIRRLTARDGWGRPTRKLTRLAFYIRSHWLRMPPLMLARHLWTKWRKGRSAA